MKNIAIILAGGSGNRFGSSKPKQFLCINGKTILEWSINAFSKHKLIDEIIVVCHADWIEDIRKLLGNEPKISHIIAGGEERYLSTVNALKYVDDSSFLLIHDAVRPMIDEETITACINSHAEACAVGIPTTDTVWECTNQDGVSYVNAILKRDTLYNAQTPQCFQSNILKKAFDLAMQDNHFIPTDDCSILLRYCPTTKIQIILGKTTNIKITYPSDLDIAKEILTCKFL